jgi:hypothetical protein
MATWVSVADGKCDHPIIRSNQLLCKGPITISNQLLCTTHVTNICLSITGLLLFGERHITLGA